MRTAGDWYGSTVNMAVRVAEAAEAGELLMTEGTRAALGRVSDLGIVERGVHALKGLPDSVLHGTSAIALQAA